MKAQPRNNKILLMCPPETLLPHFSKARNFQKIQMSVTWHWWTPQHRAAWDEGNRSKALPLRAFSKRGGTDLLIQETSFFPLIQETSSLSVGNKSGTLKTWLFQNAIHQQWNTHLQFRSKQATNSHPFHTNGKYYKCMLEKAQFSFAVSWTAWSPSAKSWWISLSPLK